MNEIYNSLIEFGKTILKNTDYLHDEKWIKGAESFYNDKYKHLAQKATNDSDIENITLIMLAQFELIDTEAFWTFFSHYCIRTELEEFECKISYLKEGNNASSDIGKLESEFDSIIDKFNADFNEQEKEWLSERIDSINNLLKSIKSQRI